MKDQLLEKIGNTLRDGVRTETSLVYLLVEIRKLMDRDNYQDVTMRSFTDWIVHIELTRAVGATDLLKEFDDAIRLFRVDHRGTGCPQHYSFREFQKCLQRFFARYNLASQLTDDREPWVAFTRLYAAVVSDCPITFTASRYPLKYVLEIQLKNPSDELSLSSLNQMPFLEWEIKLKDGTVERHAVLL